MSRFDEITVVNGVQDPVPVNISGHSVFAQDIDVSNSDTTDWVGGDVEDLFDDLNSTLVNSTTDNPKTIIIAFNRIVSSSGIAVGDANGGTHAGIKIEALRGGNTYTTLRDNSASVVPFNSRFYSFSATVGDDEIGIVAFTQLRITFATANTVSISSIGINKTQDVVATLQGLKPDGTATFIGATNNSNLRVSVNEYGDTPAVDAFARLRISEPFTLFDSKQLHDKQPLFWDESIGGSATSVHSSVNAETLMSVTASASDYAIRQTKQRFNYQPGKSQLIFMTFRSPQNTGVTCKIGPFDGTGTNNLTPNNGIFLETDGDVSWNICKNGTTTETVLQANWNVDRLDGTGPSKIELDWDATLIMIVDYEWLGVGRCRVGFVIDGLIYYCHYFNHANDDTFTSVYMSTPNAPLRYQIESDGSGGGSLQHICSSVISEGGQQKTGVLRAADTGIAAITGMGTGTSYAVVGIRLKSTHLDVTVIPESISAIATTNDLFKWELQLNPTLAVALSYSDLANSAVQTAKGSTSTTVTTAGIIEASGYASVTSRQVSEVLNTALKIGSTIAGVRDELVLVITPLSANTGIHTSLNFRELL